MRTSTFFSEILKTSGLGQVLASGMLVQGTTVATPNMKTTCTAKV